MNGGKYLKARSVKNTRQFIGIDGISDYSVDTPMRSKLSADKLLLRQQQGFTCVMPTGHNAFSTQFERVLPASSVANFYPFNYSGKTDAKGFYIGKDRYGSNVLVAFDQRDNDKTSANILILGNSG